MSFATGVFVARGLGPEDYGLMMFLLGTFIAIQQLLDLGTSSAFFTFLSEKKQSWQFARWYFAWLLMQFLIPLVCIGFLFSDSWLSVIWHNDERPLILMACLAAFFQHTLWTAILRIGESQRLTICVQGTNAVIASVHCGIIFVGFSQDLLDVKIIFLILSVEWLVASAVILRTLNFAPSTAHDSLRIIAKKYWVFCRPLAPYAFIGFGYEFADRWLLQNFGGSTEQAYFAVANQISMIVGIVTASIISIFWKEVAEASEEGNHELVGLYYDRVTRGLFFFCSVVVGFFVPWAGEIIQSLLGEAYSAGSTALIIMLFYPIYQTMWEIGSVAALATKRVSMQVVAGSIFKIISIFIAYFFLAPSASDVPGLGLGASGLALKMLASHFLLANIFGYYLSHSLKIKFRFYYQPITLIFCVGFGVLSYWIKFWFFASSPNLLLDLIFASVVYSVLILFLAYSAPQLAGLQRSHLKKMLGYLKKNQ